jgi:hypothetical protein
LLMDGVRVLAMDHYFDQDLCALETHPGLSVRRFPYQRLRNPALRMLGSAVATGLQAYNRHDLQGARQRYAAWLRVEVQRLYLEQAFDVIVLPSDAFFYVRSLPAAAHHLGVPVVVVQKETSISVDTMEEHSQVMRVNAPPAADFMTVCSERHREFWLRAGASENLIEVTGQPRFDLYASQRPRPMSARKRVLFLAYELDAYVPGVGQGAGLRTWEGLRDSTEAVLVSMVRSGRCEVVVKCHPQQKHRIEKARWTRTAGPFWNHGLTIAEADADTRSLILGADVVVGFQTTALYEAVAAARSVVYAAWGEEYERFRSKLLPFHEAPASCVRQASSAEHLAELLGGDLQVPVELCRTWYEAALGPVDGHATERVAHRLQVISDDWPASAATEALEARRRRFAVGLLVRSAAAEALWTLASPIAQLAGQDDRVNARRHRASEGRSLAATALRRVSHG